MSHTTQDEAIRIVLSLQGCTTVPTRQTAFPPSYSQHTSFGMQARLSLTRPFPMDDANYEPPPQGEGHISHITTNAPLKHYKFSNRLIINTSQSTSQERSIIPLMWLVRKLLGSFNSQDVRSLWWRLVISIIHWKRSRQTQPCLHTKGSMLTVAGGKAVSCGYIGTPLQG